jgi:hypothetical protein
MIRTINIAADYTPYLGGRYEEDGEGNGTTFRKKFLLPHLTQKESDKVVIELDGAAGYPSSFLEEAFGGLIREEGFSAEDVLATFKFKAEQPGFQRFVSQIKDYIRTARPKVTG